MVDQELLLLGLQAGLAASFTGVRVWGPSARFDGERVGRHNAVLDGDVVEILR